MPTSGYNSSRRYNFARGIWSSHGPFKFSEAIQGLVNNESSILLTNDDLGQMRKEEAAIRKREEEWFSTLEQRRRWDNMVVPQDPTTFYHELGLLEHPYTRQPVPDLTEYQKQVWLLMLWYRFLEIIKSQKIGLTTSVLMTDIQFGMLPSQHPRSCRGKEIIIIGQDFTKARDHLTTIRQMLRASPKYAPFVIEKPESYLLRDEVSKVTTIYLHNPENINKPTIIRGLGSNESAVWSWKNVKHIHISDIAAANIDYDPTVNAAMTRLVNTRGSMIIETPPRGPHGKVYEIFQQAVSTPPPPKGKPWPESRFVVKRIHYSAAVKAGVISEDEIDNQRAVLGDMFPAYFEAEFITVGGNAFSGADIDRAVNNSRWLRQLGILPTNINVPAFRRNSPRAMGIDPAYSYAGSRFAIVIAELLPDPRDPLRSREDFIHVVYSHEAAQASPMAQLENAYELFHRYGVSNIYIDDTAAGYIRDLKRLFGENINYERILKDCKKDNIEPSKVMKVVPVNFRGLGPEMMANLQYWLHHGTMAISNEHFGDLVLQMRSAQLEEDGDLDKSRDTLDLIDGLRLACWDYIKPTTKPPHLF